MSAAWSSAWSSEWDDVFATRPWGRYPPEELVVFVSRTFRSVENRRAVHILEVGCGPGANIWYIARERFSAAGIDGSIVAIDQARHRLAAENLNAELSVSDMAELPFPCECFNAVIDVGSVQHNRWSDQLRIMSEVRRVLIPDGKFFAIMLAGGSWGEGSGEELEPHTFRNMTEGPAQGCGLTHYFAESELPQLFSGFSGLSWERRERTLFERRRRLVHWLVTATR